MDIMDINEEEFEKIMKEFLPFIKYLARKLSYNLPRHMTIDDLISAGLMGLADALSRYEPGKARLKTYAELRIKGTMIDEIRATAHLPRIIREKINKINEARAKLEKKYGRAPDDIEIAKEVKISLEDYRKILQYASSEILIPENLRNNNGDDMDITEVIADPSGANPFDILSDKNESGKIERNLAEKIDALPDKEKTLLYLYYHKGLTMREIGKALTITESRVCQIHSKALKKLKIAFQKSSGKGEIEIRENKRENNGNCNNVHRKKMIKKKGANPKKKKMLALKNGNGDQTGNKSNFLWN